MLRLFTVLFLAKLLSTVQCNDECCYAYGSVPINHTNCVPKGRQFILNYIIYNPHDNFTNVTVNWFRSNMEDRSTYELLPTISEEHQYFISRPSAAVSVEVTNCTVDIYRDTYSIAILKFTREKNGYYWCQLAINNTYTQSSHHAWFYADQTCSSLNYHYFRPASLNEVQCTQHVTNTSLLITTSTSTLPKDSRTTSSDSTILQISSTASLNEKLLIYVLGSFSALLLIVLLGVLVLAFSFAFYVHRLRKKTKHQQETTSEYENEEYDDIHVERATFNKEESHVYQTLKLNEMNYESMYAKIMPTKK